MVTQITSESQPKAVYSITSVSQELGLSRSQFYNLQKKKVLPPSLIDRRTGRSYMDDRLLNQCRTIKKTGVSYQGTPYLFYRPRKKTTVRGKASTKNNSTNTNPIVVQFTETLSTMGLSANQTSVSDALESLYPDQSYGDVDHGEILRQLYKHLKNNM